MLLKISTFLIIFFTGIVSCFADLRSDIIPDDTATITESGSLQTTGTGLLDNTFTFVKDSIFGILILIAIGMFLYVGLSLIKAQGNPEELKKAFTTLTYVIIGLAVVSLSWLVINLVTGITFT